MSSTKLTVEETMELSRVITTLEDLLESLRQGSLTMSRGSESVTLLPPGVVEFEMEVSQKKDKSKLTVEISWKGAGKGAAMNGLKIG